MWDVYWFCKHIAYYAQSALIYTTGILHHNPCVTQYFLTLTSIHLGALDLFMKTCLNHFVQSANKTLKRTSVWYVLESITSQTRILGIVKRKLFYTLLKLLNAFFIVIRVHHHLSGKRNFFPFEMQFLQVKTFILIWNFKHDWALEQLFERAFTEAFHHIT